MDKLSYVHTVENYTAIKKEWTIDTHNNLHESQRHYAEFPIEASLKGYILYGSNLYDILEETKLQLTLEQ